jgi:hypothetical protein
MIVKKEVARSDAVAAKLARETLGFLRRPDTRAICLENRRIGRLTRLSAFLIFPGWLKVLLLHLSQALVGRPDQDAVRDETVYSEGTQ